MNDKTSLQEQFAAIHAASRHEQMVTWATRQRRLKQLLLLLKEQQGALTTAIEADFGQRNPIETTVLEIVPSTNAIKHALKHGEKWMRRRSVGTSWLFRFGKSRIQPQPKGVVGIIAPWNYPLFMLIGPLVSAFVAGNRAMIKTSEYAPHFAEAMAEIVPLYFQSDELCVVTGGVSEAIAFTELPFDHIVFTGSTQVGKQVMRAASANLTPVTLELGGKSPVIIANDVNLEQAVARIMYGKMINAGQTCIAPDYVLLPHAMRDEFIRLAKLWFEQHYPDWANNTDFTCIINNKQLQRLQTWLNEAQSAGCQVVPLASQQRADFLTPCLAYDVPDNTHLCQDEIFGPILPLVCVDSVQAAIDYINMRPRPLACYVFGDNHEMLEQCVMDTVSGGMCINDVILHVAQDNLPFGGIGPSGMGAYHGQIGFDTLSHLKAVFIQSPYNFASLMAPPYGKRIKTLLKFLKP